MYEKEKHQILTSEKLETVNVWHFCVQKYLNDYFIIKLDNVLLID